MSKTGQFTDVIHDTIPYSGIEYAIISTPIFNRLHRVLQSSLVYLTYPSNKVKRFEHSIGTMHLAGEIFFNSICNASEEDFNLFMENMSQELITWRNEISFDRYSFIANELRTKYNSEEVFKMPVPKNHLYNKYYPKFLKEKEMFSYYVAFQGVRIAGLLHDVGHLPYSHILEYALKKIYDEVMGQKDKTDVEESFIKIMTKSAEGGDEIHEEIGKLLINNIRSSISQSIVNKADPNIYFFLAAFDFAEKILCSKPTDNSIYSNLHFIIASVLDADRLDYCTRDAFCSGTNKAVFPYRKLLTEYRMIKIEEDSVINFYFCPSTKSVTLIEELLRRRLRIYSEINYHHRVHKHEILLEEVIAKLGLEELHEMKEIENLPYTMPLSVSSIWKLISKLNQSNDWPEYQIIQLDDSWLDTLLKNNFFEKYKENYLSLQTNGNDVLWNRFDELISTTKRYHSFFKRSFDFREFDKMFYVELKEFAKKYPGRAENIRSLIKESYNDFFNKYHSFIFNYVFEILFSTKSQKEAFFESFETNLNISIKKEKDIGILDCLLRSCMFSFGYQTAKTPLFLYDSNYAPIRIEQISSQLENFQKERAVSPIFHLYYLPTYDTCHNISSEVDKGKLLKILAEVALHVMEERLT